MCLSWAFIIEGGMWDVIVLIPDHYLSVYFLRQIFMANYIICMVFFFCS